MNKKENMNHRKSPLLEKPSTLDSFFVGCLDRRLKPFSKQLKKVAKGKNSKKKIHNLRTSCRKIRTLVNNFQAIVPTEVHAGINLELKTLTAKLGLVRELEVLEKEIDRSLSKSYTEKAALGLSVLKKTCQRIIESKRGKLDRAAKVFKSSPNYLYFVNYIADAQEAEPLDLLCESPEIQKFGEERIKVQLDQVAINAASLDKAKPKESFHQLRIQLKILLYTLADFSCVHVDEFHSQRRRISTLLKKMGRIHDRQVWIAQINEVLAVVGETYGESGDEFETTSFAVRLLKSKWFDQIDSDFKDFKIIWRSLKNNRFWDSFFVVVED